MTKDVKIIATDGEFKLNQPIQGYQFNQNDYRAKILKKSRHNPQGPFVEQSYKRTLSPNNVFPDGILMKSNTIVARQGFGKTSMARAICNYLLDESQDGWLHNTIFNPPVVIWSNSLLKALEVAGEQIDNDTNYLLLMIDDAIRHASAKRVMTRYSVSTSMDYAEIRHILEEECGMKPKSVMVIFWMTQRWWDLSPFMRQSDWIFWKGINNDDKEQRELRRIVGDEGFYWLLDLVKYIMEYHEFDLMRNCLAKSTWMSIQAIEMDYEYDCLPTIDDMGGMYKTDLKDQAGVITNNVVEHIHKHPTLLKSKALMFPVLRSVARGDLSDLEIYVNVDYCIQDALHICHLDGTFDEAFQKKSNTKLPKSLDEYDWYIIAKRLEGLSFPEIAQQLAIDCGYNISYQAIQGRIRKIKRFGNKIPQLITTTTVS